MSGLICERNAEIAQRLSDPGRLCGRLLVRLCLLGQASEPSVLSNYLSKLFGRKNECHDYADRPESLTISSCIFWQ